MIPLERRRSCRRRRCQRAPLPVPAKGARTRIDDCGAGTERRHEPIRDQHHYRRGRTPFAMRRPKYCSGGMPDPRELPTTWRRPTTWAAPPPPPPPSAGRSTTRPTRCPPCPPGPMRTWAVKNADEPAVGERGADMCPIARGGAQRGRPGGRRPRSTTRTRAPVLNISKSEPDDDGGIPRSAGGDDHYCYRALVVRPAAAGGGSSSSWRRARVSSACRGASGRVSAPSTRSWARPAWRGSRGQRSGRG